MSTARSAGTRPVRTSSAQTYATMPRSPRTSTVAPSRRTPVTPGSRLYVFSDGVFEITPANGPDWDLDDFQKLVLEPPVHGCPESRRLLETVRERAKRTSFEDDFSLMTFTLGEPRVPLRSPDETWPDRG